MQRTLSVRNIKKFIMCMQTEKIPEGTHKTVFKDNKMTFKYQTQRFTAIHVTLHI